MTSIACLFGTFDVANYGNLLFPALARSRLEREGFDVVPVAPTAGRADFTDAPEPVAAGGVLRSLRPAGIIIGGGNIVHVRATALADYAGQSASAYGSLWLGATIIGATCDVPIAWNAPGVPHKIPAPQRGAVRMAAAAASYVSVRDDKSLANLKLREPHAAVVAADSALDIEAVWPLQTLTAEFVAAFGGESPPFGGYIAVHVKRRSTDGDLADLARSLDGLALKTGRAVVLVALAACHGDDQVARELGALLKAPTIVVDRPRSLKQIAALIANADLYVGASLHGYITSVSYGRPGILVAKPLLPKFTEFAAQIGRSADVVEGWQAGVLAVEQRLTLPPFRTPLDPDLTAGLDAHWRGVVEALNARERGRPGRTAFLRALAAIQLQRGELGAMVESLIWSPEA